MAFDALWINASGGVPAYNANELRTAMALDMMYDGRAVGARQGVRPGGTGFQVSVDGSLNITVKAGIAEVDPGLSTPQGPYRVAMTADDSTTLDVSPHDPTNPRIDIVYIKVRDHDEDGSGLRDAVIAYTAGTPAGSPVQPSTPASSLLLASLAVPAVSGAVAVTDRRVWTVATGGILPVNVAGDIAAALKGRYRDRLDTNVLERDTGAAWETVADPNVFKAWPTWVPTLTNLTVGGGTLSATKLQVGKTLDYDLIFTFGAGSAVGTVPKFTPPATPHAKYAAIVEVGRGAAWDSSGNVSRQLIGYLVGANIEIYYWDATPTQTTITATAPWTWATGDIIHLYGHGIELA